MLIYIDSSALVKMLVDEPGSLEIKQFAAEYFSKDAVRVVTAVITKAEIMAALAAMRRGKHLTQKKFEKAVTDFRIHWKSFYIPTVSVSLIDEAGELGLNYKLKGCDAFQLASALDVNADLLISADKELNIAASETGLSYWNPMTQPIPSIFKGKEEGAE